MFKFLRKKIGIIGYGNLGSAIAERIKKKFRVYVFDKDTTKTSGLAGISVSRSLADLVIASDVIIIAVKPQDFDSVLNEIKDYVKDKLVISIAAGITTGYIEKVLGRARIIRAMPNIGAVVGESTSYICKGKYTGNKDLRLSVRLFNCIGHSFILPEDLMNAATAVGGSGPGFWGYLFDKQPPEEWDKYKSDYFIPELTSAAYSVGFDKKTAKLMAKSITFASLVTVNTLHITPEELSKKVASKGGTTEAGLEVLEKGGTLTDAVRAAKKRAEELSKKE
jgi:pyrroline-5-carboxylate reductase